MFFSAGIPVYNGVSTRGSALTRARRGASGTLSSRLTDKNAQLYEEVS